MKYTRTLRKVLGIGLVLFGIAVLFEQLPEESKPTGFYVVSPAHAVVGRPMSPVSYAGVARRTARRRY